jgi:hypothetical protein
MNTSTMMTRGRVCPALNASRRKPLAAIDVAYLAHPEQSNKENTP